MGELKFSINIKQAVVTLSGLLAAVDNVMELHVLPPRWATGLMIASVVISAFLGKLREAQAEVSAAPETPPTAPK